MKRGMIIFWSILALLIVGGVAFTVLSQKGPGKLDSFAQCLTDSGTVYYGAFWCPHCQATNRLFGKSKPLLPYVECSTADGQSQTQICQEKGISSYPTWVFPNGSTLSGERTLAELAEGSGCALPQS